MFDSGSFDTNSFDSGSWSFGDIVALLALFGAASVSNMYAGGVAVTKAYFGSTQVFG